jgi:hypothetical protein
MIQRQRPHHTHRHTYTHTRYHFTGRRSSLQFTHTHTKCSSFLTSALGGSSCDVVSLVLPSTATAYPTKKQRREGDRVGGYYTTCISPFFSYVPVLHGPLSVTCSARTSFGTVSPVSPSTATVYPTKTKLIQVIANSEEEVIGREGITRRVSLPFSLYVLLFYTHLFRSLALHGPLSVQYHLSCFQAPEPTSEKKSDPGGWKDSIECACEGLWSL